MKNTTITAIDYYTQINDLHVEMCRECIEILKKHSNENGVFNMQNIFEQNNIETPHIRYDVNMEFFSKSIEIIILNNFGFDVILNDEYVVLHSEIILEDMCSLLDSLREYNNIN